MCLKQRLMAIDIADAKAVVKVRERETVFTCLYPYGSDTPVTRPETDKAGLSSRVKVICKAILMPLQNVGGGGGGANMCFHFTQMFDHMTF